MSRYLNKTIYFVITVPSIQICNYYNIVIENVLTGIKCSKLSIFVDICIYLHYCIEQIGLQEMK